MKVHDSFRDANNDTVAKAYRTAFEPLNFGNARKGSYAIQRAAEDVVSFFESGGTTDGVVKGPSLVERLDWLLANGVEAVRAGVRADMDRKLESFSRGGHHPGRVVHVMPHDNEDDNEN